EGAAEGRGLGHYFLRHIERNATLLFLIPVDSKDISQEYAILLDELRRYNPELLDKNRLVALSKSDMLDAELIEEMKQDMAEDFKDVPYIFISSISGLGIQQLKDRLWALLNE